MNLKKLVVIATVIGILGAAGAVYAAAVKTPADIAAGLTGKSVEDLYKERAAGKTYGTIAKDAGKLEEFKKQVLEQRKAILDQRVKEGTLSQQRADEIYAAIKNNQTTCDGSGSAAIGRKNGVGFGQGSGMAGGRGAGMGAGNMAGGGAGAGMGAGRGMNR